MAIGIDPNVMRTLTNPGFTRGMFEFGSALGGIGAQRRAKQRDDQFKEVMERGQALLSAPKPDPAALSGIAQELQALGYTQEAGQFTEAARKRQATMKREAEAAPLRGAAMMAAARSEDPAVQTARVRAMSLEDLIKETAPVRKPDGTVTKGQEVTLEDPQGNLFTRVIQYDNKSGSRTASLIPYPGSPEKPTGQLRVVSSTTGLAGADAPQIAGERTEAVEFNKLRVAAIDSLAGIENSIEDANASLDLLNQIQTGGFSTSLVRQAQDFFGQTPEDEAAFNFMAAQNVLNGLSAFSGAISEGERQYLERMYQSLEKSEFANRAILNRLLAGYERALEDAQLRADSTSADDYLEKRRARKEEKDEAASAEEVIDYNDFRKTS